MNVLHRALEAIARTEPIDAVATPVTRLVRRTIGHGRFKDVLSGVWLGHPLHSLVTDVPIGCLMSATILDVFGGDRRREAADTLVVAGLLGTIPTVLSGASDWSDTDTGERRIGVVHGLVNVAGVGLYAASIRPRRAGRRSAGTTLGLAGLGLVTIGGYLGGALSYDRGVGVNRTAWQQPPRDWTPVASASDLDERQTLTVDAAGVPVLLYRSGAHTFAISNHCSHAGGPLADGTIDHDACTVTCPWHRSAFRLDDGSVVHGPATSPQPALDVRIRAGTIEVRSRG